MEDHENIYDKIKELLGTLPDHLSVLEDQIDIELQLEYFESSKRIKNEKRIGSPLEETSNLFKNDYSLEYKKNLLTRIASLEKVEAYRIIEKYLREGDEELKCWALLALQENRMLLESRLLDENHVFISTGLGGRGQRLRYFVVIFGNEITDFSDFHKRIIRTEFEISMKNSGSVIEELNFSGSLATLLVLIPMKRIIKQIFSRVIEECNLYGNFLISNFIITNVKILSFDEIREYLKIQDQAKKNKEIPGNC